VFVEDNVRWAGADLSDGLENFLDNMRYQQDRYDELREDIEPHPDVRVNLWYGDNPVIEGLVEFEPGIGGIPLLET